MRIWQQTLNIVDPATGEIIVEANHLVTPKRAEAIIKTGVDKVKIRTILTCRSHIGVCAKCYGTNMATGQTVQVGEAVGIIAAQSIGEPAGISVPFSDPCTLTFI